MANHAPIWISRAVQREHKRCAPSRADTYLDSRIETGFIEVHAPRVASAAERLQRRYRALSPVDAEGLAWAKAMDAFFLTEDRRQLEAAEAEEVAWVDLTALLLACKEGGLLTTKQLATIVAAIELDADHTISAAAKGALGI